MSDLVVAHGLVRDVGRKDAPQRIVDDVSFGVPRRSLFAITGPSGSGKTTLLNLLSGLDRPTAGEVIFDGQTVTARTENELARWRAGHVGVVFQFFHLLPTLTALENLLLALELGGRFPRRDWRARALQCLADVGVESLSERLPRQLSGGEQQRVAIARALVNDPPLVVADEPTGNLDSVAAANVLDVLQRIVTQLRTVVIVTHDQGLASHAHAAIALRDGRIVSRIPALENAGAGR